MLSLTKLKTTILLASALLLCTSPLAAALRSRPGANRMRFRAVARPSRASASARRSSHSHATASAAGHHASHCKFQAARSSKPRFYGQQSIDPNRTLQIQQALIRGHYLGGEATGEWDQATRDALTRFQAENHWQTKILPDARALIKLGLGPSCENLLNPETAAISMPYPSSNNDQSAQGSAN